MSPNLFATAPRIDATQAIFGEGANRRRIDYEIDGETLRLQGINGPELSFEQLHHALDAIVHEHEVDTLAIPQKRARELPIHRSHWHPTRDHLELSTPGFYQIRQAWLAPQLWPISPQAYVEADCPGGRHPVRPRIRDGKLYRKYLGATGEVFELHRARIDEHLETFHRWQNDPRVAETWNEDGTLDEHEAYLRERRQDPHIEPLIGTLDGEAFAYAEIYWAREDRIGPHCEVTDYDQGLHLLVGEEAYLGGERTAAWMRALFHMAFLREPRTQRLVGEPAADNEAVHERIYETGWTKHGEFDFPHKRASLITLAREDFFRGQRL